MSIFENFHMMFLFLDPIYYSKNFLVKLREGISILDKLEQIWFWSQFEILKRKLKMMLNLCYLPLLFRIFAISFCTNFQLIWDRCVLKGNSILYNFYLNRGNQISTFSRPIMRFTLLLKIMKFFWAFFFGFFMDHINLQKIFKWADKMP